MSDPYATPPPRGEVLPFPADDTPQPQRIGRYRIERVLGKGGFGLVYLAHDDQLNRLVAIKVPHPGLVSRPQDADAYLTEARTVASLDHPHIVPVHDVGSTEEYPCYVVSKYIDGSDLARRLRQSRLSLHEGVELVATVAEALHHAHKQRLVHRDIKPENILLDTAGKPYVADFGLALREQDVGRGPGFAGTPAYMSPEQARGEGHRVDGRSDIFSLGVVLYELLTGRRPFKADSVGELLEQIAGLEAPPPRQLDDRIPKGLERICLKALAKRASERYTTATDMADDLRHFLAGASVAEQSAVMGRGRHGADAATPTPGPVPTPPDRQAVKVVPKGLRSFDAGDADFFLELLPGPRDRDGLPDSIRFWKGRIEETDPDSTFAVGLIYGPSGCGKSSLVKAGLLPRLSDDIIAVYVEATAAETESRLLNGLRKRCPGLPSNLGLRETLAALRRGQGIPVGKKVLIILDQFEQWLHARKAEETTELVQALRQCDGSRVQGVVMVRDDFGMAATRFMAALDIPIVQGTNFATVDLFDPLHARKVLAAFGRPYGRLPDNLGQCTRDQAAFLDQAVAGLAQDGKVVSVRLALFAEMVKGKPWTPATLREVGGIEGVGVTFLEDTFSSPTANPKHRLHQKAARGVLKDLLPDSGTDIKGTMRSHAELMEASGYAGRPRDFDELLRILDGELRLITPTDPEGVEATDESTSQAQPGQKYYQLTHDYLVPSLRDWLTRKQKETRRGRAELRLAERAASWQARPESRHLPAWWEWANIRLLTHKTDWTPPQRRMMRQAARFHAVRGLVVAVFLALLGWGVYEVYGRVRAESLVESIVTAETGDVPHLIEQLAGCRRWADPRLLRHLQDSTEGSKEHLHASLALLPVDEGQVEYLYQRLLDAGPAELPVVRDALLPQREALRERLWGVLEDRKNDADQRLRAASALAKYAPEDNRWEKVGGDLATKLATENSLVLGKWLDALRPAGAFLLPPLATLLEDEKQGMSELRMSELRTPAVIYGNLAEGRADAFARLETRLETRLAERPGPDATEEAQAALARRQANIGAALVVMGHAGKVWPLLKHSPNPTVRSYLIERLGPAGVEVKVLAARLGEEPEVSARQAVILGLGQYDRGLVRLAGGDEVVERLLGLYRDDPDGGIHATAEWVLRTWAEGEKLKAVDAGLATGKAEGQRRWFVNRQGQTMVVVPPPGEVVVGEGEGQHRRRVDWSFAIAAKEVTVEQFRRFRKDHEYDKDAAPTEDCPVNMVSWYEAAAYCNWLSEREGVPAGEWCYLPNEEGKYAEGMKLAPDWQRRTGYRLPSEWEWEHACRAGSVTAWSCGRADNLLERYAWFDRNSLGRSRPVGSLKPNEAGLFDMMGNAMEWCQGRYEGEDGKEDKSDIKDNDICVFRGGSFVYSAVSVRSANRLGDRPSTRNGYVGFRPARTFR